jgi:RHS repeat-associated protein
LNTGLSDYYPGGMQMPGRTFTAATSNYRYGFNGKEKDNEIKGEGNQYDYGMRIYDPRVGRFLSVDPLTKEYPELTPYQFASNRPIDGTDKDGLEWELSTVKHNLQLNATLQQQVPSKEQLQRQVLQQAMMAAAKRPQPQYQRAPVYTSQDQQRHDAITAQKLSDAGYNADGTPKPLTKLAENKTWNNFADNIAFPMMTIDGAYGLYKGGASLLLKNIPYGFSNAEKFAEFGNSVRTGLTKAGYNDVEPILQGSSVTGKSFSTGQPFDVGRVSDFDVALASPTLLDRAKTLGIELRSGGTRTGPLMERDLRSLGLYDLSVQLTKQTGREVNFMIYDAPVTATNRAPSISLPPLKK